MTRLLVTADTHIGYRMPADMSALAVPSSVGIEVAHRKALKAMNHAHSLSMFGRPFGAPLGVLVAGDLTEDGKPREWQRFAQLYHQRSRGGLLSMPVYESIGNHDKHFGFFVKDRVRERHGDLRYRLSHAGFDVYCLGEAPDDDDLAWLTRELDSGENRRPRPFVLYFYFPLKGPYSDDQWFGCGDYREKLAVLLRGRPIEGIFHGHFHGSGHYRWEGVDIYNVGSAKHHAKDFVLLRRSAETFEVSAYNYELGAMRWRHRKPASVPAP